MLARAEERKGRFLKRGDGRRAADQAKVGRLKAEEDEANRTRRRRRASIEASVRREERLREEGIDLHYTNWDPTNHVEISRKQFVGAAKFVPDGVEEELVGGGGSGRSGGAAGGRRSSWRR